MRTETIEELRVIARLGSFSAASRELHIARSALAEHVNSLEREVGFPIFARGQRVTTTTAGEAFIEGASSALDMIGQTVRRCRSISSSPVPDAGQGRAVRVTYLAATPATLARIRGCTQVPLEFVQYTGQHSFFHVFERDIADCLFQFDYSAYPELVGRARELGLACVGTGPHPQTIVMGAGNPLAGKADHLARKDLDGSEVVVFQAIGYEFAVESYREVIGPNVRLSFRFSPMDEVSGWFSLDLANSLAVVSSPEADPYLECRDDLVMAKSLDGVPLSLGGVLVYRAADPNPNVLRFVQDLSRAAASGSIYAR